MLAVVHQVPYGGGLSVSTTGAVISGLILLAVPAIVGFSIRKVRQGVDDMKATTASNAVAIKDVAEKVDKLVVVVAGEEPSLMNPRPVPGLATAIMGKDGLNDAVRKLSATVEEHGRQLVAIARSSDVLVKDTQTNGGSSSRDALDRIEESQARTEAKSA